MKKQLVMAMMALAAATAAFAESAAVARIFTLLCFIRTQIVLDYCSIQQ